MKLATIERITEIKDIEGADKIQAGKVLGYWTVIKKGEFQENSLCVFHFPDTVVDITNPVYSFLKDDARVRVRKFRKQISQGLALPLSAFDCFHNDTNDYCWANAKEGDDVSAVVKAVKYEKTLPVTMLGKAKGNFPAFLKKTDETNLRSAPRALKEFEGRVVYITQKMDGCSATYYFKDGEFGACSRNWDLKEDEDSVYWKIARQYNLKEILTNYGRDLAIQGEIHGPGIQGNKMGLENLAFAMFDYFDINSYKYSSLPTLMEFSKHTKIPMVPIVWIRPFRYTLEELIELANQQNYSNGQPCEGIVIRPAGSVVESEALHGRLSVKIISERFALRYGE